MMELDRRPRPGPHHQQVAGAGDERVGPDGDLRQQRPGVVVEELLRGGEGPFDQGPHPVELRSRPVVLHRRVGTGDGPGTGPADVVVLAGLRAPGSGSTGTASAAGWSVPGVAFSVRSSPSGRSSQLMAYRQWGPPRALHSGSVINVGPEPKRTGSRANRPRVISHRCA